MKKIAVIADTHGQVSEELQEILRESDLILHAGDVCSRTLARVLDGFGPMVMVRGNNDVFIPYGELRTAQFQIEDVHFFMLHNRNELHWDEVPPETDVVIFGHTHQYYQARENGRLFLNPGSCGRPRFSRDCTMIRMLVDGRNVTTEKIVLK